MGYQKNILQKGLSVVIPNYNGVKLFPETLPTVFAALQTISLPSEVIVVDDSSTDDSINYLQKNFPSIKIIASNANAGFSVTANRGIKAAQYDLVLLLNNDVKLEPDYLLHQLHYFEQNDTFGVMGRIVGWNDNKIQDGAKYPSFHNLKIKTSVNYLLKNEKEMKDGLYTMYISGANALLDKEKFLKIGGFNELFSPFYVEDFELSLRAWRSGWKCYYDYQSICRHQTSSTINSTKKKEFIKTIYNRNKMFLHAIHLPLRTWALWMIQLTFEIIFQTLLLKTYYFKAFILFLKKYKEVKSSRAEFYTTTNADLLSVGKVSSFIRLSVKNKKIKFF